jgi:hypothetical protein
MLRRPISDDQQEPSMLQALLLGLGEFDPATLPDEVRRPLVLRVLDLYSYTFRLGK